MSQTELASACRLHRAYIGGIEQGRRNPTWRVLAVIASGLDLGMSELVQRAETIQADLGDAVPDPPAEDDGDGEP